jgi:hypothetical protein
MESFTEWHRLVSWAQTHAAQATAFSYYWYGKPFTEYRRNLSVPWSQAGCNGVSRSFACI